MEFQPATSYQERLPWPREDVLHDCAESIVNGRACFLLSSFVTVPGSEELTHHGMFKLPFARPLSSGPMCTIWFDGPVRAGLLDETDGGGRLAACRGFLDGTELGLVASDVFSQSAPDALRMAGAHDHAAGQFALRSVGENVHEVHGEFFEIVMNHHQVTVLPL